MIQTASNWRVWSWTIFLKSVNHLSSGWDIRTISVRKSTPRKKLGLSISWLTQKRMYLPTSRREKYLTVRMFCSAEGGRDDGLHSAAQFDTTQANSKDCSTRWARQRRSCRLRFQTRRSNQQVDLCSPEGRLLGRWLPCEGCLPKSK